MNIILPMLNKTTKWYKLDNSAQLYPVMTTLNTQSIFRISVELKDEVRPERLRDAVERAFLRYPSFKVMLRRGVFWYYFEENLRPAVVMPDSGILLERFNLKKLNEYPFRVSYFGRRVSFDFSHALSDAIGGIKFLKAVLANYFVLGGENVKAEALETLTDNAEEEDSFLKYFAPEKSKLDLGAFIGRPSHKLTGEWIKGVGCGFIQGFMPASEIAARAKAHGASVTCYLVALAIKSIFDAEGEKISRPINIMIPMNLRKIFPSVTVHNFVLFMSIRVTATKEMTLSDYIRAVDEQLKAQSSKENMQDKINMSVRGFAHPVFRFMPLPLKWLAIKIGKLFIKGGSQTMIISSVGIVDTEGLAFSRMALAVNVSRNSAHNVAIATTNGELAVAFSRLTKSAAIEQKFFSALAADGVNVTVQGNLREELV